MSVASDSYDEKTDTEFAFQKWTVSPSKVNLGPDFRVTYSETEFTMPDADVTLQATYIDESTSGRLRATAEASSVSLGYDEELGEYVYIEPPYDAFEWSPDGGATWYKAGNSMYEGEEAMLKQGNYTVIWRSNDPCWQAPTGKTKVWVGDQTVYGTFTYVPQVTVDVLTIEDGGLCGLPTDGGTVTMNPKDGLVPARKTIALAAKAAKDYVFQGWALGKDWEYGEQFEETGTTWKLENYAVAGQCSDPEPRLNRYIDPTDKKVHVVAVFKALSAYSADDIVFEGFAGYDSYNEATYDNNGNASVTVKAVVGCALDEDYALACSPLAGPLAYKLDWFAMSLVIAPDGTVTSEENAAWTPEKSFWDAYRHGCFDGYYEEYYGADATVTVALFGDGALYSEAKSLENYYWIVSCEWNDIVRQQYSWKEDGSTEYANESALDFDGFFFNVAVKGCAKGAINLVEKSPAPWVKKSDGESFWNCYEDKNGNEITDPSQLSISFTKATGIFTGKANAYFDYPKPTSASLPYSGVMIYEGEGGYVGFGSAVHTYKYSYQDDSGKAKSDTKKVTLPVSLTPSNP